MAAQPEEQASMQTSVWIGGESTTTNEDIGDQRPLRAVPDPMPEPAEGEFSIPDPALAEPGEEIPEVDPAVRPRSARERWVSWVLARLNVPHLVTEDRPSLLRIWRYARYSEQLPPSGPARIASVAYLYAVALPIITVGYTAAWIVERPARAGIAAAVLTLARLFEPTHLVLIVVLAPLKFLVSLLTN